MYSNTSALDINNAPRPHLMSRVAMQEQLDYTDFAALVRQEESRFWAVVFKHRFRPECCVMLWTGENGNLKVTPRNLPECRSTADLFGNPLPLPGKSIIVTDLPQYLTVEMCIRDRSGIRHRQIQRDGRGSAQGAAAEFPEIPEP